MKISALDERATNGLLHVVPSLLPSASTNALDFLSRDRRFTTFMAGIQASDLVGPLRGGTQLVTSSWQSTTNVGNKGAYVGYCSVQDASQNVASHFKISIYTHIIKCIIIISNKQKSNKQKPSAIPSRECINCTWASVVQLVTKISERHQKC